MDPSWAINVIHQRLHPPFFAGESRRGPGVRGSHSPDAGAAKMRARSSSGRSSPLAMTDPNGAAIVTWIPSIYPLYVSIYSSTMDPMGDEVITSKTNWDLTWINQETWDCDIDLERIYSWLVVTGTMEFDDFPFSWECHHPNWLSLHHFSEGWLNHNQVINHH